MGAGGGWYGAGRGLVGGWFGDGRGLRERRRAGGQGLKDLEQGCTLWNGQRSLMKDFMGRAWVGLKRLFVPQKGYLGLERALKDEPGRVWKGDG